MPEHSQHMPLGIRKCKRMLGHLTPPDAYDKHLTCFFSCVSLFSQKRNHLIFVETWLAAGDPVLTFNPRTKAEYVERFFDGVQGLQKGVELKM